MGGEKTLHETGDVFKNRWHKIQCMDTYLKREKTVNLMNICCWASGKQNSLNHSRNKSESPPETFAYGICLTKTSNSLASQAK